MQNAEEETAQETTNTKVQNEEEETAQETTNTNCNLYYLAKTVLQNNAYISEIELCNYIPSNTITLNTGKKNHVSRV